MKTVVSVQDLLEYEIRPGALLDEYQRLSEAAVRAWPAASFPRRAARHHPVIRPWSATLRSSSPRNALRLTLPKPSVATAARC